MQQQLQMRLQMHTRNACAQSYYAEHVPFGAQDSCLLHTGPSTYPLTSTHTNTHTHVCAGDFGFTKRLGLNKASLRVARITHPRWVSPEVGA